MSLVSTFSALSARAWQSLQAGLFSNTQVISTSPLTGDFGASVEQSGDSNYAIIGAGNSNKVFMYLRNNDTYSLQTSFTGSGSTQYLGTSTDLNYDGTYAIVGASQSSSPTTFSGQAKIYTRSGTTWTLEATLTPSDPTAFAGFGCDVGINDAGDIVVVGTESKNAVYIFTRSGSTWTQQAKLMSSDGVHMGVGVDINSVGDRIIAGADLLATPGAVYVFDYVAGSWTQTQKVVASDGAVGDEFGGTVALTPAGTTFVAGAAGAEIGAVNNAGALYVFTLVSSTWTQQAKLTGSLNDSGRLGDQTGQGVSIDASATTIVGGAPNADTTGVAYVFQGAVSSWNETQILRPNGTGSQFFGSSSAISDSGKRILVGAPNTSGLTVYAFAA